MSETETEGMYADLGDIVDPGVFTEDDDTSNTDPGVWTEDDGSGTTDQDDTGPGGIVDPETYPEAAADDSDGDGGLLGDIDLSGALDEMLDTDDSDSGILDGLDDSATDGQDGQDWLQGAGQDMEPIDQM